MIDYKSYSRYGKTRAEVQQKIEELKRNINLAELGPALTVEAWINRWLRDYVAVECKPTTLVNYQTIANKHIIPAIGTKKISRLKAADVQRLIREKINELSPRTVNLIHHVIRAALNQAVKNKLVHDNVALNVSKPRVPRREMKTLSADDVKRLEELAPALRSERLYPAFILLIYTGLRRGELLGLKWSDIDFDTGTLTVVRSLAKTKGGLILQDTKTATSNRRVPLSQTALAILKKHKAAQAQEKLLYGDKYNDQGLVFARENGLPIYPDTLRKVLLRILDKAGLPHVRVHDLRHTFATLLLEAGENPKVVAELMGHANIGMTLGKYSHVRPNINSDAIGNLENFVHKKVAFCRLFG